MDENELRTRTADVNAGAGARVEVERPDVVELLPGLLYLLRFVVGQAYLWRDKGELTLIDAGPVGSAARTVEVVTALGHRVSDLRRIVVTHFHEDHMGGAAELAELSGARVYVHRLDAPFVRGETAGPQPVFEDWEVPIRREVAKLLPADPPTAVPAEAVDEVEHRDVLDFGGGARIVGAPGHTDGSIGIHLPRHGVLFTGDAIAVSPMDGEVILGVFNVDRKRALASFRELAALDPEVACFGHGEPVLTGAGAMLRAAAGRYED
ncbi:MBL fold metallo-hydrolase [Streptomyces sp. LHD-70]|uniref:MBL fold metallo-hydrolase n=1 Tax=Streptomyces sp. LHD-70 TaxID=3072140 RepID=UPI00280F6B1C|nr:MBL fold metallo-hydrolase [Streptomyces sp. LHD-70]MDQ8702480.1 MBL fold metallo-hydrolase [Streptomyces sp. LHD-70]